MSDGLVCTDLGVRFGKERVALREISARFTPGLWAVIGPNGAGKSTLLRALAGVQKPSDGRVTLDVASVYGMAPKRRASRIAYVAQRSTVWAGFDVRAVVEMGRHAHTKNDRAVDRAIERVGLRERADDLYRALSVGQQQRVTVARALAQLDGAEHGVLIADEPLSAQDPAHGVMIMRLMRSIASKGGTVITALHDCTTALRWADHALLLSGDGHLVACAPIDDTLTPGRLERVFAVPFDLIRAPGGPALLPSGEATDTSTV